MSLKVVALRVSTVGTVFRNGVNKMVKENKVFFLSVQAMPTVIRLRNYRLDTPGQGIGLVYNFQLWKIYYDIFCIIEERIFIDDT